MQARPIRREPSSSSFLSEPQGAAQMTLTIEAQGPWNVARLLAGLEDAAGLPDLARGLVRVLAGQLDEVEKRVEEVDARILAWHKADAVSQRLATIPGIGPLTATAIAAT